MQLTGLVSATPPVFFCICDNRKIVSETLLGYEAGYRKLVTLAFTWTIATFHNKYNDLASYGDDSISTVASPPPPYTLYFTPGSQRHHGIHQRRRNLTGLESDPLDGF